MGFPLPSPLFSHLESRDGDAEQLELLGELEDGEQNGAEEGDLQEAEHYQPRKQEVPHSPAARKRRGEREANEVTNRGRKILRKEGKLSHLLAPTRRMTEGSRKTSWTAPAIRMWVYRNAGKYVA